MVFRTILIPSNAPFIRWLLTARTAIAESLAMVSKPAASSSVAPIAPAKRASLESMTGSSTHHYATGKRGKEKTSACAKANPAAGQGIENDSGSEVRAAGLFREPQAAGKSRPHHRRR